MNIKLKLRRIIALTISLVCLLAAPAIAYATDISVSADSTSVKVGDTITVTVTVSAQNLAVADGVFTYDPALLSYVSSNGGASDGYINLVSAQKGGSSSLTTIIKFLAIGDGEAIIDVSLESVLDYEEQSLADVQAGVSITIAPSATDSGGDSDGDSTPPIDHSLTGVAAHNVMGTQNQMYIWRSLSSLTLPSGFADRQVTYAGEFVGGAAIPDNEDIILLYLSEASGENAGYYIYDEQKDILFAYLIMKSISANYTLIWPDEDLEAPQGFEQTTIEWKDKEMPAWIEAGSDGSVYLVYVRTASGEVGFFLYNIEDESMQRYKGFVAANTEPTSQPTTAPPEQPTTAPAVAPTDEADENTNSAVVIALIIACALLAIIVIILAILYMKVIRHNKKRQRTVKVKSADI